MRRWALSVPIGVLLVAAVVWVVPWASRDRDIPAAVPGPPPLLDYEQIALPSGASACARDVGVDARSAELRLAVGSVGRAGGPPLTVAIAGPGYRAVARVPGGYGDFSEQVAAIARPAHAVLARVCVRNDGPRRGALAASADQRSRSRSVAEVGGVATGKSFALSFHERSPHTVLARLPQIVERISAFRPGIVRSWLLWPLAALVVLGL